MSAAEVEDLQSASPLPDVALLLAALRKRAELLRRAEAEKVLRRMEHLPHRDREAIEALTQCLLDRVLHEPTARLLTAAATEEGQELINAACYLFELDVPARNGSFQSGSPMLSPAQSSHGD